MYYNPPWTIILGGSILKWLHAEAGRFSLLVPQELDRRSLNLSVSTAILKEERTREDTVRESCGRGRAKDLKCCF